MKTVENRHFSHCSGCECKCNCLFSTVFMPRRDNQSGMSILRILVLAAVCFRPATQGQSQTSAQVPFAGCYRIVSQSWHPTNEDAVPIPQQFQLRSEAAAEPSGATFSMRSVPASGSAMEKFWAWQPRGGRLWISWRTGMGGFRGTLKQSHPGEFVGKIEEWCDSHLRMEETGCQNSDSENRLHRVTPRNCCNIAITLIDREL